MEEQLLEIREQQKASWNKFSPGWKKWDAAIMDFLRPMGEELIPLLQLKATDNVLDLAAGTGEPGLSIAAQLPKGKVLITDLSQDMLVIAREQAAKKGILNVDFETCDVCELPYDDNSFDAISCRLGLMFFPDMGLACKEMYRVLKPGGRLVTSVWDGPEKNFWVTAIGATINRNMQLPPPAPGAPGMFRCAAEGLIAGLFEEAGLKNIAVKEVACTLDCGTADTYWNMMTDVAAPFVAALSNAADAMQQKIKTEVLETVNQKFAGGPVIFTGNALIIYGEK